MMGENRSLEQTSEEYSRKIYENRFEILKNFYDAFVAYNCEKYGYPIDLQSIKLIEEEMFEGGTHGKLQRCWRWEYQPKEFLDSNCEN